MTIETAELISKAFNNKLCLIKFTLRGEPLLNPNINQIINILHKNNCLAMSYYYIKMENY